MNENTQNNTVTNNKVFHFLNEPEGQYNDNGGEFIAIDESFNNVQDLFVDFSKLVSKDDSEKQPQVVEFKNHQGIQVVESEDLAEESDFKKRNEQIINDIDKILQTISNQQIRDQVTGLFEQISLDLSARFAHNKDLYYLLNEIESAEFVLGDPKITEWFLGLNEKQRQIFDTIYQHDKNVVSQLDSNYNLPHLEILQDETKIRKLMSSLNDEQCRILQSDHNFLIKVTSNIEQFKNFNEGYVIAKKLNLDDYAIKRLSQNEQSLDFVTNELSNAQHNKIKEKGLSLYINNLKSMRFYTTIGCGISSIILGSLLFITPTFNVVSQNIAIPFATCLLLISCVSIYSTSHNNRIINRLSIIPNKSPQELSK